MKKYIAVLLLALLVATMAACTNPETGEFDYMSILLLVGMLALMYFMMIRPQNKQKKKEQEMRSNLEVGDGVTTIGGIIGRVVSIKDDSIVLATSPDNTHIRLHKGSIQEVEKLKMDE